MVNSACVFRTAMSEAENVLGGTFRSSPGVLVLPVTDGNCADTFLSGAQRTHNICRLLHAFIQSAPQYSECIHSQFEWFRRDYENSSQTPIPSSVC